MLQWTLILLLVGLSAGLVGFCALANFSVTTVPIFLVVLMVVFTISLFTGFGSRFDDGALDQ